MFNKISLQKALEILYEYECKYDIQMNLNMDVNVCNIILMTDEWTVEGAYFDIDKPFSKKKFISAIESTIEMINKRDSNA